MNNKSMRNKAKVSDEAHKTRASQNHSRRIADGFPNRHEERKQTKCLRVELKQDQLKETNQQPA